MTEFVGYRHGWNNDNPRFVNELPRKLPAWHIDVGGVEDVCRRTVPRGTLDEGPYVWLHWQVLARRQRADQRIDSGRLNLRTMLARFLSSAP